MPLPGGSSAKLGVGYEALWTVLQFTDILSERIHSIRLEPPGDEGKGVEFCTQQGKTKIYHQVKRQKTTTGRWTIADLKEMLAVFGEKLTAPDTECVFVSQHSAYQLEELSFRAQKSESFEEFERDFLNAELHRQSFQQLCDCWKKYSSSEVYEALKRVTCHTIDEDTLRGHVRGRLQLVVEGEPDNALDVLAQMTTSGTYMQQTVYARTLWKQLRDRGYRSRDLGKDAGLFQSVTRATDRYLKPLKDMAIGGRSISRQEACKVVENLLSESPNKCTLVTGDAGVGKSGVIVQVVEELRTAGWHVLAFRVDRLMPTQLPDEVGGQLVLRGSPALCLAAVSKKQRSVLVVDQLDAVSNASGRHPEFFECIDEIIDQALRQPQCHVILACRGFDLAYDYRLGRLKKAKRIDQEIKVAPLTPETVKEVIREYGQNPKGFSETQIKLLSIPLHLWLLGEALKAPDVEPSNLNDVTALYDAFWRHKQTALERLSRIPIRWTEVIERLRDQMNENESLIAPAEILDDYDRDVRLMTSENVLVKDGNSYAFFHQGFFDYAYARSFFRKGKKLIDLLKDGEQTLFRRSQVKQILTYKRSRGVDESYIEDLRHCLNDSKIRFHIKDLVFKWLGRLSDPCSEEWQILKTLLENEDWCKKSDPADKAKQHIWRLLHGSVAWFNVLDAEAEIEKWIESLDDEIVDRAVFILGGVQKDIADRVAVLVGPHLNESERWNQRLVYLVQVGDAGAGSEFFAMTLRLLDEGLLDESKRSIIVNSDFWSVFSQLPQHHPECACEMIAHYLERRKKICLEAGDTNPFEKSIPESQFAKHFFMETAERVPQQFVEQVLPFMLQVIEQNLYGGDLVPYRDVIWSTRLFSQKTDSVDEVILGAMEQALCSLASRQPPALRTVIEPLRDSKHDTIQYLIERAYAANGEEFGQEAAAYLLEGTFRMESGYSTEPRWATRQLLESITPHCTAGQLDRLEDMIMEYYPEWERGPDIRRKHGYTQFVLLSGMAESRLSDEALKRLAELRRKFGRDFPEPPREGRWGSVHSPIPKQAALKMSDEQWLRAMSKYGRVRTPREDNDFFKGGSFELAGVLEEQTKAEPERFANLLINKMSDELIPDYFNAILRGIAGADLGVQKIVDVCDRCHSLPGHPCGRWICSLVEKSARLPLPGHVVEILEWYACHDPDPDPAYASGMGLWQDGVNSVRGSAAMALGRMLFEDDSRTPSVLPILERMVDDPSLAVRSCVAYALTAAWNHDRDVSVRLFKRLTNCDQDLLGTEPVEHYLTYALRSHFDSLETLVSRMLESDIESVRQVGARRACVAGLTMPAARPLMRSCLEAGTLEKAEAAKIFGENLPYADFRAACENQLIKLFHDSDEKIHEAAGRCFFTLAKNQIGNYSGLVKAYVKSPAFDTYPNALLVALERSTGKLPDGTLEACEKFLALFGEEVFDIQTSTAALAESAGTIVVRLYTQGGPAATRSKCLDFIDRMALLRGYGLGRVLSEYDR